MKDLFRKNQLFMNKAAENTSFVLYNFDRHAFHIFLIPYFLTKKDVNMKALLFSLFCFSLFHQQLYARIIFSPYYSVSSTKSITGKSSKGTETEKISKREEKGLAAGLALGRWFKLVGSVGQSFHVTTSQENTIKDEYEEIDFDQDFDSSTTLKEKKKKETQNRAKFTFVFDPSFWIFIMRVKLGVTAKQRIIKLYADDELLSTNEPEPKYNPHAGAGLGIRIGRTMYGMIEYNIDFYKFPETAPFEREVSVSYGVDQ